MSSSKRESPPHILLTNYVMLELMLTRTHEQTLIDVMADLRFLVLDELHTYRGRQGADVALLVRRLREAAGARNLIHVGTSATLAGGAWDEPLPKPLQFPAPSPAERYPSGPLEDLGEVAETQEVYDAEGGDEAASPVERLSAWLLAHPGWHRRAEVLEGTELSQDDGAPAIEEALAAGEIARREEDGTGLYRHPAADGRLVEGWLEEHPGWYSRQEILDGVKLPAAVWNRVLAELTASEQIEIKGENRGTRYRHVRHREPTLF